MDFSQVVFIFIFLPLSILLYFAFYIFSKRNLKVCNAVFACESLVFFWWAEPKLILFFIILTVLMHMMGFRIYNAKTDIMKKQLVRVTVIVYVSLLIIYKYLPSLRLLTEDGNLSPLPIFSDAIIPLGISFFVLGSISYIIDIYEGKALPGSLIDVFTFAMMFPKAICGPVVLWRDFSPQIHNRKTDLNNISNGLKRIIIGYAKKAILANSFAVYISLINTKIAISSTDSATVWIMGLMYFFRLYFDFSGYSDIAIGLCNLFGFNVGENFNIPYLSASITDFWRRWHISLGRWFREYIYIPLGGKKTGNIYVNIFITFLLAGLWHGWRMPILLWAILNAIIVIVEKKVNSKKWYKMIPRWSKVSVTILLVYFGWILFMAPDMTTLGTLLKGLIISPGGSDPNFTWKYFMTKKITFFMVIAAISAFGGFSKLIEVLKSRMNRTVYDVCEKILLLMLFAISIMFVLETDYIPFVYSIM